MLIGASDFFYLCSDPIDAKSAVQQKHFLSPNAILSKMVSPKLSHDRVHIY